MCNGEKKREFAVEIYCFNAAVQFRATVMGVGAESPVCVLIRKRQALYVAVFALGISLGQASTLATRSLGWFVG
jgi:hypothetical protein